MEVFGKKIELTKQQKIIGGFALVGLVLGIIALRKKSTQTKGTNSSGSFIGGPGVGLTGSGVIGGPVNSGSGSGETTGDGGGIGGVIESLRNGISIGFDYLIDTSSEYSASAFKDQSSSGGGGLGGSFGGFGFSLSGSKSNTNIRKAEVLETARNLFDNQTVIENANEEQFGKILDFFKEIGGTYAQRALDQSAQLNAARDNSRAIIGNVVAQGTISTTGTSTIDGKTVTNTVVKDVKVG